MQRHYRSKHCSDQASSSSSSSSELAKEALDACLVDMIIKDCQPFSIVEGEGFREFVKLAAPTYVLPSRKSLKAMVEKKYVEEKEKAKADVKEATAVCLTSDMWTSLHMDAYLAVTCHFVNSAGCLTTVLLGVGHFPQSHTALNIAEKKTSLMEEWAIKEKVNCLVTDGAQNMIACGRELQMRHTICIAHALNLVVKKAMEQTQGLQDIRERARKIVGYFRSSTLAKEQLTTCQTLMSKPQHKLIQEIETRWNSTYDMMARLYEQREPVGASLATLHTNVLPLSSADYLTIQECLTVLSPMKSATEELSAEKAISGSKIIPLVRMLRHNLASSSANITDEKAAQLCRSLLDLMTEKLSFYEVATQTALATLLDPRFKVIGFCNPNNAQNAIKKLTAECAANIKKSQVPPPVPSTSVPSSLPPPMPSTSVPSSLPTPVPSTSVPSSLPTPVPTTPTASVPTFVPSAPSTPVPTTPTTSETTTSATSVVPLPPESGPRLWDLLDQQVLDSKKIKNATASATVEVQRYLSELNVARSEDPLVYWAQKKELYPHLYELALKYLCIPASSVPCERVFSKAGEIVSKKRNRLCPKTVEKILFLNKNNS
ncbi:hypothetical protein WMY93_006975 [Mugilogobius chulae]|uniref:HAT C-terminal dimerisation domain-containing protein n=1 Tax=Mugilogobius chulae TaxID=88201 RepID=A0AAW0PM32_9GOBI